MLAMLFGQVAGTEAAHLGFNADWLGAVRTFFHSSRLDVLLRDAVGVNLEQHSEHPSKERGEHQRDDDSVPIATSAALFPVGTYFEGKPDVEGTKRKRKDKTH